MYGGLAQTWQRGVPAPLTSISWGTGSRAGWPPAVCWRAARWRTSRCHPPRLIGVSVARRITC